MCCGGLVPCGRGQRRRQGRPRAARSSNLPGQRVAAPARAACLCVVHMRAGAPPGRGQSVPGIPPGFAARESQMHPCRRPGGPRPHRRRRAAARPRPAPRRAQRPRERSRRDVQPGLEGVHRQELVSRYPGLPEGREAGAACLCVGRGRACVGRGRARPRARGWRAVARRRRGWRAAARGERVISSTKAIIQPYPLQPTLPLQVGQRMGRERVRPLPRRLRERRRAEHV